MSYSFSITANSKTDATRQIREQFDAVVVAQPPHAADREAAVVAAQTLVRLLADPSEGDEICVSINGSLSWTHGDPNRFVGANLSVYTSLRTKSP